MARVDLIRDNDAKWVLTELEMVEPSLFFRHAPEKGEFFADSIIQALEKKQPAITSDFGFKLQKKPETVFWYYAGRFMIYVMFIPMYLGHAYMMYWRHGRFLNDMEHNLFIGSQTLVSLLTFLCHCKAHLNDPGVVKP